MCGRFRGLFVTLSLAVLAAGLWAGSAWADGACGPGMKLGSENDGRGLSWKCIPDMRSGGGGGGGGGFSRPSSNPTAAGLQGAAGLLDALSTFASLIDSSESAAPVPVNRDPDGHGVKSRDANSEGIGALRAGDFDKAAKLFRLASREAIQANDVESASINEHNEAYARAEILLIQGLDAERAGKFEDASRKYLEARVIANWGQAKDLEARLSTYNDSLAEKAAGTGQSVIPSSSYCSYVNTRLTCQ